MQSMSLLARFTDFDRDYLVSEVYESLTCIKDDSNLVTVTWEHEWSCLLPCLHGCVIQTMQAHLVCCRAVPRGGQGHFQQPWHLLPLLHPSPLLLDTFRCACAQKHSNSVCVPAYSAAMSFLLLGAAHRTERFIHVL